MPITLRPSHTTVTQTTSVYPTPAVDAPVVDEKQHPVPQKRGGVSETKSQKSSGLPTPASVKATPKTKTPTTTQTGQIPIDNGMIGGTVFEVLEVPVPLEDHPPLTQLELPVTETTAPETPVGCESGGPLVPSDTPVPIYVPDTPVLSTYVPGTSDPGIYVPAPSDTQTQAAPDSAEVVACDVGNEVTSTDAVATQQKIAPDFDTAFAQLNPDLFQQAHAWADANSVEFNLPDTASLSDIVAWRTSTGIPLAVSNDDFSTMLSNLSDYPSADELSQIWQAMGMTASADSVASVDSQLSDVPPPEQVAPPVVEDATAQVADETQQQATVPEVTQVTVQQMAAAVVDPLKPNLTLVQSIRQWADRHGMACDLPDSATMDDIDAWRSGPKTASDNNVSADTLNSVRNWAANHGVVFSSAWTPDNTYESQLASWRALAGTGFLNGPLDWEQAPAATVDAIRVWATQHGVPCFLPAEPTNEQVAQWREGTDFRVPPPAPAPATP